ncbi:MAG: hypothetical protein KF819_20710 [Labilithrix sp.]|nr:hypothetical protein [Labilithrix sp.]
MIIRSERRWIAMGLVALVALGAPARAWAQDAATPEGDALDPLRERFRQGMEKYRAGDYATAILIWEAIYRELGADKGYRLAFNLARAYDAFRDSTKAAEYFESYVQEVERRRNEGEVLEPNVEKQDVEAKERLEALAATKGRIKISVIERPVVVQIGNAPPRLSGFVAYVDPGTYTVRIGAGKDAEAKTVAIGAGEIVEIAAREAARVVPAPPRETRYETRVERPFGEAVLWASGALTLAAAVIPAITYGNALSTKSDYDAATSRSVKEALASDYEAQRSNAYASLAIPAILAAVTGGLAIGYFAGSKEVKVPILVTPNAASIGWRASF